MSEISTLIEGKYDVIAKIREGGMGTIYKVRHRLLEEIRVVKVMRQSVVGDTELKRRFLEEAKTATRLKHPNIATIHDFALGDDGTAYLVMEFIDGVTLGEVLKSQGPVGLALGLEIAHQTLLALGYLHRKNVVHRDIAPDNLMLTYDEEGYSRIKLIDLGIAKVLDRRGEMTSTGVFLGKVRYASPEQYGSLVPGEMIDGRSDLYSLGLVLYELLTGHRPFVGDTPIELLRAHVFQEPTSFSMTDPEGLVPEGVRAVVFKALKKRREDRFISAQDFDREILSLKGQFSRPFDIDPAQAIISLVRGTPVEGTDFVTPSAQDRLDRHFRAHPTPVQPTNPRGTAFQDTVVDPEAKEALLLNEIRERESKGDLHGLESVAQAYPETSRTGQAAREAVRRLRERANFENAKRQAEEADWREGEAQASETAWQRYVDRYPDSPRRDEASQRLAEARDFRKAHEAGTSRAWKAFVEQWPRSSRRDESDKRLRECSEKEEAALAATIIGVQEKQARLLDEIKERERAAAKQRELEARRQREAEKRETGAQAIPGGEARRGRRYVALAATVLIAAAGAWILTHRANKSNAASEVPIPAAGGQSTAGQPTEAPSPVPAAAPALAGSLVVDALPWAEVVRVEDSGGKNWLSGKQTYTPMVLALPPGKYSVVMKNSDFPDRTLRVPAEVGDGASASCIGRFQPTDAAAYFEMEGWRR